MAFYNIYYYNNSLFLKLDWVKRGILQKIEKALTKLKKKSITTFSKLPIDNTN